MSASVVERIAALRQQFPAQLKRLGDLLLSIDTAIELIVIALALSLAWQASRLLDRRSPRHRFGKWLHRARSLLLPVIALLLLLPAGALLRPVLHDDLLLRTAVIGVSLLLYSRVIRMARPGPLVEKLLLWIGIPVLFLQFSGLLAPISAALDTMSIEIGNLRLTVNGLLRVALVGSLLFWLGWVSNRFGQNAIRRQEALDVRTREVIAKLYQIALSVLVFLLLLQVMGINLTALAVFGGALGVGLGFGLQSVASNFISGIILLFDRSLSVGDYVELEGGLAGHVREMTMRYTNLETFDGKSVLVPNEKFITSSFHNWTHRHLKQRYRVDFSVSYRTDIRALCQLMRTTVASHPQVLSGPGVPIEEQADCEIASFGDSGINMFVEFWMEGIDDGANRVGGDLMLLILETLQRHGIEMPYPQREVRVIHPAARTDHGNPSDPPLD